jgi:Mrp family chromosome partitioning ATPase
MNGPTFAPAAAAAAAPKQAAPRPAGPARPAAKPDPDAGGGMRVFTYLRLHWLMILFCGTLLGSVGAYAVWELMPSKYESYALLQVSSAPFSVGSQGNRNEGKTDFVTYLKTTAALIKSEFVINAAIRDGRLHELPTIKDQKEPIKFLDEEIQVAAEGTELIRITFKGHNPAEVKRVVDSVQQAFMKEVVEKEVLVRKANWAKVQDAMGEMRKALDLQRPEKDQPRGGATGVVPASGTGGPGAAQPAGGVPGVLPQLTPNGPVIPAPPAVDPDELLFRLRPDFLLHRYTSLRGEVERLPGQINDAKVRLKVLEARLVELRNTPPDQATLAAVDADREVFAQAVNRNRKKHDYERWIGIADPNSPGMIDAKKAWDAAEADLKKLRQEKLVAFEQTRHLEGAKKIRDEGVVIAQEIDRFQAQLKDARERLAKTETQLLKLPPPSDKSGGDLRLAGFKDIKDYDPRNTALSMEDSIFARLVAQYHLTKLELDSPERVRVLQPASQPTQKDMRKQILGTVFAGLLGYALVALGVVAFETMSKRVSSLADLKASGPVTVVGVIPCQPHEATGRDPVKRAAANEAIDKLRAYVAQTWLARGATTVAVTSPLGDEGKAFAAFGLASSLAQAGYRTLLVDFDLREPALHAYAGVPNQNGICEVLRGEVDVRSAVQLLPNGLHMVAAGKWSDEARKAAVGGKLEALLARLKEPYDCVVIHAHALLTVAETVEIARRCEVVLVSAQYRQTKMPLVKLAADRVATMEIPFSGVVYVGATEQEALC